MTSQAGIGETIKCSGAEVLKVLKCSKCSSAQSAQSAQVLKKIKCSGAQLLSCSGAQSAQVLKVIMCSSAQSAQVLTCSKRSSAQVLRCSGAQMLKITRGIVDWRDPDERTGGLQNGRVPKTRFDPPEPWKFSLGSLADLCADVLLSLFSGLAWFAAGVALFLGSGRFDAQICFSLRFGAVFDADVLLPWVLGRFAARSGPKHRRGRFSRCGWAGRRGKKTEGTKVLVTLLPL